MPHESSGSFLTSSLARLPLAIAITPFLSSPWYSVGNYLLVYIFSCILKCKLNTVLFSLLSNALQRPEQCNRLLNELINKTFLSQCLSYLIFLHSLPLSSMPQVLFHVLILWLGFVPMKSCIGNITTNATEMGGVLDGRGPAPGPWPSSVGVDSL